MLYFQDFDAHVLHAWISWSSWLLDNYKCYKDVFQENVLTLHVLIPISDISITFQIAWFKGHCNISVLNVLVYNLQLMTDDKTHFTYSPWAEWAHLAPPPKIDKMACKL